MSSAAETSDTGPASPPVSSRKLFFAVFPSIMLPMFLAALDQTIVATALPSIAATLGDVERISWVVVSYLVAATIAAPVYGRLGDFLGRKRLLIFAQLLFIAASLLCGWSSSILMLTAARVLQGLGAGGLMTLSQALVGEAVPPRERGRFQAYLASIYMVASTFGPVAGGWLTQHFGWPSVFLVNLPIGLAAIGLMTRLPKRPAATGRLQFDLPGVLLFAGFIAPALLALEQVQHLDPATLPTLLLLAGIAAASLVLLLRQERRAATPLLPLALLRQPTIWRSNAMGACVGGTLVSLLTFLPIYLEVVRDASPSDVGLLLLPLTTFIAFGAIFTGRMVSKTGLTAIFPSCGLPVLAAALTALALFVGDISLPHMPFLFAIIALSCGTTMPVVQTTVQFIAGPKQLGAAAGSVQFTRTIGSAVGTAITGTVLFAVLAATDIDTAHLFTRIVEEGPSAMAGLSAARAAVVQNEIAAAFRAAFLTVAAFAAGGALLAWSIPVRRFEGMTQGKKE